MKLYLSSNDKVPSTEKLFELIGKNPKSTKMAIIPNARDAYIERIRRLKINKVVHYFKDLGVGMVDLVDLRKYNTPDSIRVKLGEYDLIWAGGGNTFMLRYEMKRSGFDIAIHDLLKQGVVYGGGSAGIVAAGPTLRGIETADNPEHAEEVVWEGLGLIDTFIFPHVDDVAYSVALGVARQIHPEIIELRNSQACVVNGSHREIIG